MFRTLVIALTTCFIISLSATGQSSLELVSPEHFFFDGIENIQKSNFATAKSSFQNFVSRAPDDERVPLAKYYIAYSSINLYNLNAEQQFAAFVEDYPTHPRSLTAYYELGKFYYRDKNYKKAVEYFEKTDYGQLTNEQQGEVRFKLAYSYFNLRNLPKALENFNILKRGKNKYADVSKYYAGFISYQNENYDLALSDLKSAAKNETYAPLVPSLIGNIYFKQERYDELIAYANEVMDQKISPNQIKDLYLLTAEAYFKKDDFKNSLEFFKKYEATNKKGISPEYQLRMAICLFNLDDRDGAIEYLIKLAPRKEEIGAVSSFYLGWIYLGRDELESAAAAFQIASSTIDSPEIKEQSEFMYGKISLELGRFRESITKLEQFKSTFPNSGLIPETDDLLSQAYVETSDYDLAIKHMESLGSMSTSVRAAYQKASLLKATQLFNQGKYRQSIDYFDKSLRYPINQEYVIQANYWKSESLSAGKKYADAMGGYQYVIGSNDTKFKWRSRYGLGYAYYNDGKYDRALVQFKAFVDEYQGEFKKLYEDALLRLADCYYVAKDYASAQQIYRRAIRDSRRGLDYAYLQSGIVYSLQNNPSSAISQFETVLSKYPNSQYKDEALFEKASLYFESGNYQKSIVEFSKLIDENSLSPYTPYAYQRRGIAHFNLGTFGRTIEDYQTFLKKYPAHKESKNVLISLQEVMSSQNRSEEFEGILAEYKKMNPDEVDFEVVEFETAKSYYNNQEYDKAIKSMRTFIDNYPEDYRVYEANYYVAESYYRLGEFSRALEIYYQILRDDQISRMTRVIARIAEIEYNTANFKSAVTYYHELNKLSKNKRERFTAFSGLMKSHYQLLNVDSVDYYAEKIKSEADLNVNALNLALLYRGKAAYYRGDFEGAIQLFHETVANAKDISGAEAQYLIGEIRHQQGNYRESNEDLFTMPSNFSIYEEWVGKGFLLIADNYIEMKEYLQARATLNSIIENTNLGSLANLAKNKLQTLDDLELTTVPVDTVQVSDTIKIDNN